MNRQLRRKILSRNIDTLSLFFCREPISGYALQAKIEDAFHVHIGSGLIYNSLMRLESDELLSHNLVIGKCRTRQTRAYSITEKGQTVLVESIQTLRFLCLFSREKIKKKV